MSLKVISHRGYWLKPEEKNSEQAFTRSFSMGFGTETDIRDCAGRLLISHDMPQGQEMSCAQMLELAQAGQQQPLTLALNIKADGLALALRQELLRFPALDCFVFDMSVPDMRAYFQAGVPVFTRMSEVEREPAWLDQCAGVWLDGFESVWFDNVVIENLLERGKRVCVVSPELHKRDHLPLWQQLKPIAQRDGLILCTDIPEDAVRFFQP